MTTSVWAHRGCTRAARSGSAPIAENTAPIAENTVAAFVEARRLGADGVELDVRRSADGALVIHHDPVVPGAGAVCELRAQDLPGHVPLLHVALEACRGLLVNVEIKNDPTEPGYDPDQTVAVETARAIIDAGWRDDVVVSSFSVEAIEAVRTAQPGLRVGWLIGLTDDANHDLDEALARRFDALHPFFAFVDETLVTRAHGAGVAVNVWTVDRAQDIATMAALGVDAVITNDVSTALAVTRDPAADAINQAGVEWRPDPGVVNNTGL